MVKVLFICMGNICRSPTAHGVFQKMVEDEKLGGRIFVDSAGTHAYHIGNPPDHRAQLAAKRRGVDLSELRARKVVADDFHEFDYVLAMDRDNYRILADLCPEGQEHKLRLFLEFADNFTGQEVPDPYYGGESGFERVLDMVENGALGLLEDIRQRHL